MKHHLRKKYLISASTCLLIIAGLLYYYFFSAFSTRDSTQYIYIDHDDNIDSVYTKLDAIASRHAMTGFRTLVRHSSYAEEIQSGRYAIDPGQGSLMVFHNLSNGRQNPVRLTIPTVRTKERLSAEVSKKLMMDSLELLRVLNNETACEKLGYDTATIICMFIPNTYEIYWDTSVKLFLERMQKECKTFWNKERTRKARNMHLTPNEVTTLASIVDEETVSKAEKPMVAGMYYNRLMLRNEQYPNGMPLQADPTVKFAWKRFDLKRIYNNLLSIDNPYNTYRYAGLPPGPIRIPTIEGIDAVLNHTPHSYLYMCAKEDFSGTHNFARTYEEHLANAARYSMALNKRGIR